VAIGTRNEKVLPGLRVAIRMLKARKGPVKEDDRPPVKPLPGRKPRILPGQLDFFGQEHDGAGRS
jgi:hypothetical protein